MGLIYDNTISTAVTQVDIDLTATPIEKGELYELVFTHVNGTGSFSSISLYANNNTTPTNYYRQYTEASGTGVSGNRANTSELAGTGDNSTAKVKIYVKLTNDGKAVFMATTVKRANTSSISLTEMHVSSVSTFTSLTELSIVSTATNGIGINSRIQLYKVAEKVDEAIVGSAVTQVDFTVDIQKGNEYLLVSDLTSNSAGHQIYLYANNNTTASNYDTQRVGADGIGVSGTRYSSSYLMYSYDNGDTSLSIAKLKLANSGLFNWQSSVVGEYGDSDINLQKYYGSFDQIITSVTSLSIVSSITNGIGIGTRLEIWKLI